MTLLKIPPQTESSEHRTLREAVCLAIGEKWRRFLIGVDGVDGAGKSTLARYLSWQLGIPSIETDLFLERGQGPSALRHEELRRAIQSRLEDDRPVIVEGVFLLKTFESLDLQPDYLIYVAREEYRGTTQFNFPEYDTRFKCRQVTNFVYHVRSTPEEQ
jgi:hypothetical protein